MNIVVHLPVRMTVLLYKKMNFKNMALAAFLALSPTLGQADDVTRRSPTVKAVSQVMPSVVTVSYTRLTLPTICSV